LSPCATRWAQRQQQQMDQPLATPHPLTTGHPLTVPKGRAAAARVAAAATAVAAAQAVVQSPQNIIDFCTRCGAAMRVDATSWCGAGPNGGLQRWLSESCALIE